MFKGLVGMTALALPLAAGAGGLTAKDAFTARRDLATGEAVSTCQTSVNGVDRTSPYSGVVRFVFDNPYDTDPYEVYYVTFQVDSANATFTETSPGVYTLTASLKRRTVAVTFTFPRSLVDYDRMDCELSVFDTPNFNPNDPAQSAHLVHSAIMRYGY